tara:strand:+ start:2614 stop:2889 length:276 start_codon:yes stop_codon:yes gene_type:complete
MGEVNKEMTRLLRLCPDITLNTRAVELIAKGDMNQVISEHRLGKKVVEAVEVKLSPSKPKKPKKIVKIDIQKLTNNTSDGDYDKSFDEFYR